MTSLQNSDYPAFETPDRGEYAFGSVSNQIATPLTETQIVPENQEWYYAQDNQQNGPVSTAELKKMASTGQLSESDLIWKEGLAEWKEASTIKGLFVSKPPASPTTPAPPSSAVAPPPIASTPPKSSNQEWFYARNKQQHGPITPAELRALVSAGQLSANDLVWRDGWPEWKPASTIKGLFGGDSKSDSSGVDTGAAATAITPAPPQGDSPSEAGKKPQKWWIVVVAVLLLAVIGALTEKRDEKNKPPTNSTADVTPVKVATKPAINEAKPVEVKPNSDGDAGKASFLTADFLHSEYNGNDVAAKKKYGSKSVTVLGKVNSVQSITLVGVTIFMEGEERRGILLGCLLDRRSANSKELESLRPGDYIKITGRCTGTNLAGTVTMDNCSFTVAASADRF